MDYVLVEQREALEDIGTRLVGSRVLILAREKSAAVSVQLEALSKTQRDLEVEIEVMRARLKKLDQQLFGGESSNSKELVGLEHEVEMLKAALSECESKSLELLGELEKIRQRRVDSQAEVAAAESDWSQDRDNLLHEQESLLRKNQDLEAQRQIFAASLPAEALAVYRKACVNRKPAVVKLERGRCQGCRIALSMTELQRVRAGGLVLCSSCGRLLYLD
jgi:predicted  nucleic acid-binding Zn-ribbon protein